MNGAYAAMWNRQREAAEARARLQAVESDPMVSPDIARARAVPGDAVPVEIAE
jgi:hypothetical protein